MTKQTRRSFIRGIATTTTAVTLAGAAGTAAAGVTGWRTVETPTGNTLYDAARTSEGVYVVGGGGIVLRRTATGYETVLEGGPTGNGNDLYGADVTDDGSTLWFVGASGAIGEYDVVTGSLTDHSAPNDVTNNFNGVSATGRSGSANVYVAGDSGKLYYSFEDGAAGTWNATTPGSGAAIAAVDFFEDRAGHAVDGNTTVFETDDGSSYGKVGIEGADQNLLGVDADGVDDVLVSASGGVVYDYDGSQWDRTDLGSPALQDVEDCDGAPYALTVGAGGAVFRREAGSWDREDTPTTQNLKAVVCGSATERDVAVGAGGLVIEH